jgi:hypothetical protein
MDVRPGGSPSCRTDPDHPLDSPGGGAPRNLTRNSPRPANSPNHGPSLSRIQCGGAATSCITEGGGSSVFVSSLTVSRQA